MTKVKTLAELKAMSEQLQSIMADRNGAAATPGKYTILVCGGTGCKSSNSGQIVDNLRNVLKEHGKDELLFAGGSEIYNIYEYARERNNVNMSKLLRYASRRGRKEQVEKIISTIDNDRQEKQVH